MENDQIYKSRFFNYQKSIAYTEAMFIEKMYLFSNLFYDLLGFKLHEHAFLSCFVMKSVN